MSLVDEVEGLIAYATAYVANLDPAFKPRYPEGDLAKHGPAILAAVKLANAADALYESDGDAAWWASQWCEFEEQVRAYRAATGAHDAE